MNSHPLIVLSLDGLVPSSLGCYGSSWSETPTIDSLAATGCTWDRCISRHADPLENLRDWLGSGRDKTPTWLERWQSQGPVELISDSRAAISVATKSRIDQLYMIDETDNEPGLPAVNVESTQLAQLIAGAVERIQDPGPLGVLWLHSDFLARCWDAPRWLIDADVDEEPEEPMEEDGLLAVEAEDDESLPCLPAMFDQIQPPRVRLDQSSNPDLITTWMTTYACQVRLVDELLGVLRSAAGSLQPTFVLCGTSGFSHGQNGWIGHGVGPLRSCQLRLPLIVSEGVSADQGASNQGDSGALRCRQLIDSDEVSNVLHRLHRRCQGQITGSLITPEQWSQADGEFDPTVVSESAAGDRAVTSSKWFFVRQNDQVEHLYLKPDDAEDSNDIGRLRHDVVATLEKSLR